MAPIGAARAGLMGGGVAIPDSALPQYKIESLDESDGQTIDTWPDSNTSEDMSVTSATYAADAFGSGYDGVSTDGTDDEATGGTLGSLGSNLDGQWSLAIAFSSTDTGVEFLGTEESDNQRLWVAHAAPEGNLPANTIGLFIEDGSGNRQSAEATTDTTDGGDYVCIINKEGAGADQIKFYFDATTSENNVGDTGTLSDLNDFTVPMKYFGRGRSDGTLDNRIAADFGGIRWWNRSLNESERQDVFDLFEWYTA